MRKNLNVMFIVQGDGRGHMTQALAIERILRDGGHRVSAVLLGREPGDVPSFFSSGINAPIISYQSFGFFTNKANTAIDPLATVLGNARRLPACIRSVYRINREINARKPDVVVNFLEPLCGVWKWLCWNRTPVVGVANQYLFLHPDYAFPPGRWLDRLMVKVYARFTASWAKKRMALSLVPRPDRPTGCAVIPPLLRAEVLSRSSEANEPFFLIYLLKPGLRDQVIDWHRRHPEVALHCFTDQPQEADTVAFDSTLTFHRISDGSFLDLMTRCRGVAATAGYQTLCEAMHFGKPILIVPVGNHFEQSCNAHETEALRVGVGATSFDFDRFLNFLPTYNAPQAQFHSWVAQAPQRVLRVIESAARP